MIPLPEKLRRKNTWSRHSAKYKQIIHKYKLVSDRYPRHLLGPDLPYHDIVQHAGKVGYAHLDHHRHCDAEQSPIKLSVANEFLSPLLHFFLQTHLSWQASKNI